ncbi:MAG: hypothetical protein WAM14_23250 [Candidatus Nitrosopolaris sp.]
MRKKVPNKRLDRPKMKRKRKCRNKWYNMRSAGSTYKKCHYLAQPRMNSKSKWSLAVFLMVDKKLQVITRFSKKK